MTKYCVHCGASYEEGAETCPVCGCKVQQKTVLNGVDTEERVGAGILGAFLFALIGGVAYFLLYQIGFIAGITGLIATVCAMRGYSFFAKKESKRGVVISVVAAAVVIVLAWYLCLSFEVYQVYQELFEAELIDHKMTFAESICAAVSVLGDSEVAFSYFGNLALSLIFCVIGSIGTVRKAFAKLGKKQAGTDPRNFPDISDDIADDIVDTIDNDDSDDD